MKTTYSLDGHQVVGLRPIQGNTWQNIKSNIGSVPMSYVGYKGENHSIQERDVRKFCKGRDI